MARSAPPRAQCPSGVSAERGAGLSSVAAVYPYTPLVPVCFRSAASASLAAALLATVGIASAEQPPFAVTTLDVPGRPVNVLAAAIEGERGRRLVVVSLEGSAPDERRHVSVFAFAPGGEARLAGRLAVPAQVVAFDVADLEPGGELEVALLAAQSLEVRDVASGELLQRREIAPALPLPPRTRGLGYQPLLAPWGGNGTLSALAPALGGLAHVPLGGGPVQLIEFPLVTDYLTGDADAGVRPGMLEARIAWPEIARGDDDGDGRPDLLAVSRYDLAVYRTGEGGLPARPSRRAALRPFDAEEELRFQATSASLFARDLDGDGLVDLVLHRTFGTLLRSDATTSIWRNRGSGADPNAPPDARIGASGGFGSIFLEDLDGDGRSEALQLFVPFSVVQLVRTLLTSTVQAELRAYRLEGPGIARAEQTYETTLTVPVDAERSRVSGILPTVRGDWNGDGLRDLLHGESLERIAIRLGERGERGARFGGSSVRQDVATADRAVAADLDGDGLDDLALYDTLREGGGVQVLRNRGTLPGAGPELRAPEPSPPHDP